MKPQPLSFYQKLLSEFERLRSEVFHLESLVGIEATITDGEPVISILWEGSEKTLSPQAIPNLLSNFSVNIEGVDLEIAVREEKSEIFTAESEKSDRPQDGEAVAGSLVDVGTSARGVGLGGSGTFGWGFTLDGKMSALSNWHVLCTNGNQTPVGWPVEIDGKRIASLSQFDQVPNHGAKWDFAIAQFNSASGYRDQFRVCDQGPGIRKPYPFHLAPAGDSLPIGEKFYTVGNRPPYCGEGRLMGVVNPSIRYNDGRVVRFESQLSFEKMTNRGDSGSVAVQESSTLIWGLMFAGSSSRSLANPLYQKNWRYSGRMYVGPYGDSDSMFEVPSYETVENHTSNFPVIRGDALDEIRGDVVDSPPSIKTGGPIKVIDFDSLQDLRVNDFKTWNRDSNWAWVSFSYSYKDVSGRTSRSRKTSISGFINFASPNTVWPGTKPS